MRKAVRIAQADSGADLRAPLSGGRDRGADPLTRIRAVRRRGTDIAIGRPGNAARRSTMGRRPRLHALCPPRQVVRGEEPRFVGDPRSW